MPVYVNFFKEILSKKKKVEEISVVKLTEHCSAILQNKSPSKVWRSMKLEGEIGENRSIPVSLQLVDQTTIIPERIGEDVLVRVEIFVFPMDFIMVDMEENREVPLILGRAFLAMDSAILDIQERQLMLRVGEERVVFKIEGAMGAIKERTGESKMISVRYTQRRKKKSSHHGCVHWVGHAKEISTSIQNPTK
ncbi:uncharacterized protein LOC142165214 [Nicotiana tabacum]|uniref:Uncharacterized protein LOC142165214 n=1 Tax=Nicotiana tabacum TaxID=4097 RepID=A0AC58S4K7_TOBAC